VIDLLAFKTEARKAAFARRKVAFASANPVQSAYLSEILAGYRGVPIAGYAPMRTEINPLPALAEAAAHGPVGMPVIKAQATPLDFREWTPECAMIEGTFGAFVPATGNWIEPEILIVPLVAYDRNGGRLGYGGGFYDRTLERLRKRRATLAIGFAFAAQEAENLPLEPTDQPLDMIITEAGIITPSSF
jgi:5-formyltetrahydrofolate cyclo-ligase